MPNKKLIDTFFKMVHKNIRKMKLHIDTKDWIEGEVYGESR